MSKKFVFKKEYSNFHPALHWNIILFSGLVILIASMGYSVYLYMYTKSQIDAPIDETLISSSTQNSTSSLPFESLKSVKNIQQVVEVYRQRADTYTEIVHELRMREVSNISTTTMDKASTSIATTTK